MDIDLLRVVRQWPPSGMDYFCMVTGTLTRLLLGEDGSSNWAIALFRRGDNLAYRGLLWWVRGVGNLHSVVGPRSYHPQQFTCTALSA